jgi:hypothetical protein
MDLLSKNRVLTAGVLLLVILNIATLGTLWWQAARRPDIPPPGRFGPREIMEEKLHLSNGQKARFEGLRSEYQQASGHVVADLVASRRGLYSALRSGDTSAAPIVQEIERIGTLQKNLDLLTIRHFQAVRALCDDGQRVEFDRLMRDVFERASGGVPPAPGPPAEGRDDRMGEPPPDRGEGPGPPPR